jgi:hypothetical protein
MDDEDETSTMGAARLVDAQAQQAQACGFESRRLHQPQRLGRGARR